jgi:hypothetical protein
MDWYREDPISRINVRAVKTLAIVAMTLVI